MFLRKGIALAASKWTCRFSEWGLGSVYILVRMAYKLEREFVNWMADSGINGGEA